MLAYAGSIWQAQIHQGFIYKALPLPEAGHPTFYIPFTHVELPQGVHGDEPSCLRHSILCLLTMGQPPQGQILQKLLIKGDVPHPFCTESLHTCTTMPWSSPLSLLFG